MLLNAVETGPPDSDRVVVLLHGMMGSAESWWRVAGLLAERGRRVIALDLPGHGRSRRDPHGTVGSAADALIETISALAPRHPLFAIGHSYGGTVLGAVAERVPVALAAFVDTLCAFRGGADAAALAAQYEHDRRRRVDPAWLREHRPFYSETDAIVEARAADRFDPVTAAAISAWADVSHPPAAGSIVVRAAPSSFVSDTDAAALRGRGVDVRDVPGAAHTVWYSHFAQFTAALPEFFPR